MKAHIDITDTLLETERLTLRPWREDDLDDLYAYASVPGVGEAAGWTHHKSIDESRVRLERFISGKNTFAIQLKETGRVIGSLGLEGSWCEGDKEYKGLLLTEIGYILSKEHWGNGLMTEAATRAIAYLFEELSLDAVTVQHIDYNDRSRRVIEKCGFRFVRDGIYHSESLNRDFTEKCYILLREEWRKLGSNTDGQVSA